MPIPQMKAVKHITVPWSVAEKGLLRKLLEAHGTRKWRPGKGRSRRLRPVDEAVIGRTDNTVRDRWNNALKLRVTSEEDRPVRQVIDLTIDEDPLTLLTLSQPGSSDVSKCSQNRQVTPVRRIVGNEERQGVFPLSRELMVVMQEMVRKEVRSFMSGLEERGAAVVLAPESAKGVEVSMVD